LDFAFALDACLGGAFGLGGGAVELLELDFMLLCQQSWDRKILWDGRIIDIQGHHAHLKTQPRFFPRCTKLFIATSNFVHETKFFWIASRVGLNYIFWTPNEKQPIE